MEMRIFWNRTAAEEFAAEVNGAVVRESCESVGLDDREPSFIVYFN